MMIYVAELTAAIDAAGTEQTWLFATQGFATRPADTPANTVARARLKNPGNLRRELFSGNRVFGPVRAGFGEVVLDNTDGALDIFATYGFDGHKFILRRGEIGQPYPAAWIDVLRLTMRDVLLSLTECRIRLRDRLDELDRPILQSIYSGSGGVDGDAAAAGRRRPRMYGKPKYIQPVLVASSLLLYQASDAGFDNGNISQVVYDRGDALAQGADYADVADLLAHSPDPGQYRLLRAGGYLRLGSQATAVTLHRASARGSALGNCLRDCAIDAGIQSGDINAADVAAINNGPSVGYFASGDETALAAMTDMAQCGGVWFGFDRLDGLRMGRLTQPSGEPVITFTKYNCQLLDRSAPGDTAVPIYRVVFKHSRVWSPNAALATSLTAEQVRDRQTEYQQTVIESSAIQLKHALAGELQRAAPTAEIGPAAATAEASRLLNVFSADRDLLRLRCRLNSTFLALDLGQLVRVVHHRFGLNAGKLFIVVAVQMDFASDSIEITLWG